MADIEKIPGAEIRRLETRSQSEYAAVRARIEAARAQAASGTIEQEALSWYERWRWVIVVGCLLIAVAAVVKACS